MIRLSRDGIVLRSILVTLFAFVVAGVAAVGYTSYATAQRAIVTTDQRLNQLLDTVHSTVRIACFLRDADLAREVSEGLLVNPEVLRVTILADGVPLADALRDADAGASAPGDYRLERIERVIHSPFSPGQAVGLVRLEPNPDVIEAQRNDYILLALQQLAWSLLLVSGAIAAALILLVVRPISRMSAQLHALDPLQGDRLAPPAGHENTEIGRLAQDVNRLADQLVAVLGAAREARLAAEAASTGKSLFLAQMSHEIRSPLTAVQGFARIGMRDCPDPAGRTTFARIHAAGARLLDAIDDILDFSRLEAGALVLEARPFRPADIAAQAVAQTAGLAAEKGLALACRPSPDLPEWAVGDPLRLRQILVHLLSNAIRSSRHGTVDLIVLRAEDELWFAVRDEGVGMTAEEIARLFRPFDPADSPNPRRYGSGGLGLAIAMNLASLMGGALQVVSTPWRGSTFTLQLPLRQAPFAPEGATADAAPFSPAGRLAGLRVLAAEDIEANRLILADLLDEAGAAHLIVANGRIALERVSAAPGTFDVVLMDVEMPEMDGIEATRRLRAVAPDLPVIGLTAHDKSRDRAAGFAAGMKDYLVKPIDPQALVMAILCWARPSDREVGVGGTATRQPSPFARQGKPA
jgi:signal transduction histidine kinase/ActR/RegA family two-component response regulator